MFLAELGESSERKCLVFKFRPTIRFWNCSDDQRFTLLRALDIFITLFIEDLIFTIY